MQDSKRFNRDHSYVSRLAKRVKLKPEELLLPEVRKRLESIDNYWRDHKRPALAGHALGLLHVDTNALKPQIGRKALVALRMRSGETIKVPCLVLARMPLFNRFEVTPLGGKGKIRVSSSNLDFID